MTNHIRRNCLFAICKHCNLSVNHHKKSEYAVNHLNKCGLFCKLMYNEHNQQLKPSWQNTTQRNQWEQTTNLFIGLIVCQITFYSFIMRSTFSKDNERMDANITIRNRRRRRRHPVDDNEDDDNNNKLAVSSSSASETSLSCHWKENKETTNLESNHVTAIKGTQRSCGKSSKGLVVGRSIL